MSPTLVIITKHLCSKHLRFKSSKVCYGFFLRFYRVVLLLRVGKGGTPSRHKGPTRVTAARDRHARSRKGNIDETLGQRLCPCKNVSAMACTVGEPDVLAIQREGQVGSTQRRESEEQGGRREGGSAPCGKNGRASPA